MAAVRRISRRVFVHGVGGGALMLAAGARPAPGYEASHPAVLRGPQFDLEIGSMAVNFTGRPRVATAVNGQVPAPLLRWREGDLVRVRNSDTGLVISGIVEPDGSVRVGAS